MRVDNALATLAKRDAALKAHMDTLNMKFRSGGRSRVGSSNGYHAGHAAGMSANLGSGARPLGGGRGQLNG